MVRHRRYAAEFRTLAALRNVHDPAGCEGEVCPIHTPTEHHMRRWPLHWRDDRGILERICRHGCGHPDPDHFPRWDECGWGANAVHGCCGCCREVP